MKQIEDIIRETNAENQEKVDWTKAWSARYPVLKTYQAEVDIERYAKEIRRILGELRAAHGYLAQEAMLVLKDILAHEYFDGLKKKQ